MVCITLARGIALLTVLANIASATDGAKLRPWNNCRGLKLPAADCEPKRGETSSIFCCADDVSREQACSCAGYEQMSVVGAPCAAVGGRNGHAPPPYYHCDQRTGWQ